MCHILGIQPEVNDGHLNATKHMLVTSRDTQGINISQNVFTGLSAVAGFLVLVFIMMMSYKIVKNRRKEKRSESSKDLPDKNCDKQTSF
ncbi:hypothetical protein Q5P01_016879 [Channa striata]|uniref:Uncharacterized protein n=1 Tax=Channa striata TaxID=64152 RepID=A0AA88M8Z3_CHASR|nr:hypothetical protein Q5P01_016879 [Channa striata]